MKFVIDIPDDVSYGRVGAFLRGWLSGFNREPRHRQPYRAWSSRQAWLDGWKQGSAELKNDSWRRNSSHIQRAADVAEEALEIVR